MISYVSGSRGAMAHLKLVIVLFRHGDRAPIRQGCYPTDPHKNADYHPYVDGGLTNKGKQRLYKVGQALRRRYDDFLGDLYYAHHVDLHTSNKARTKMSAMLVGVGVFPPRDEQIWDDSLLQWQPVIYHCSAHIDKLLMEPMSRNATFQTLYKNVLETDYVKQFLQEHQQTFRYLSEHTGIDNITIYQIYVLYQTLMAEFAIGLELPAWTQEVFPEKIGKIAGQEYIMETFNSAMKTLAGGPLAGQILKEMRENIAGQTEKKIIMYSAHETTIAFQLRLMGIFEAHVPPYGAYSIIELHSDPSVADGYSVKVFYQDYTSDDPREMNLPDVEGTCSFARFVEIVEPYATKLENS